MRPEMHRIQRLPAGRAENDAVAHAGSAAVICPSTEVDLGDHRLDALVFSSPGRPWRDVMVAGRWAGGTDTAVRFAEVMQRLWSSPSDPTAHSQRVDVDD